MGVVAGLLAAGTAFDVISAHDAAKDSKAAAKRAREVGALQADDALLRGAIEENQYRRYVAQTLGQQKAEFGARNVAVTGTALDLLSDTAAIGEEDAITIRNNAAREAWGYRQQANETSRFQKAQARNAQGQVISSLLTGGARAYGEWKGG